MIEKHATALSLYRASLLAHCYNSSPQALPKSTLQLAMKLAGVAREDIHLEAQLHYLVDSGHLKEMREELSQGLKIYQISAEGMKLAEQDGYV